MLSGRTRRRVHAIRVIVTWFAMPLRLRTPVAVVVLAIAVFAACVPSIVLTVPVAVLAPAWLYVAPDAVVRLPRPDARASERTASLLRLLPTRAPPSLPVTA
jgi:hypothetical protein